MLILTLLLTGSLALVRPQTFDPGCSFSNGTCIYSVKLGHAQHCDRTVRTDSNIASAGIPSCSCQDVASTNQNVQSLWSQLTSLQSQFDSLGHALNTTQGRLQDKQAAVTLLQGQTQTVTAHIVNRDMLLNQTKTDLANTLSQMDVEKARLQNLLADSQREAASCRGRLQIIDHQPTVTPGGPTGAYHTDYCDFEDSRMCDFMVDSSVSSPLPWKQGTGMQNTVSGPVEDHTYGSPKGHYMYIDPYYNPPYYTTIKSRKARIVSPEYPPAPAYCVRFWYTMFGSDTGDLKVYARIGTGDGYPVFTRHGQDDAYWHMAEISLDSEYTASPFRLVLEATTDSYYKHEHHGSFSGSRDVVYRGHGYTAIDDLYVYNTSCSASAPTCPAGAHKLVHGNVTSCYTFHTTAASWYAATGQCRRQAPAAHLASVQTAQEQRYLVDTIRNNAALTLVGSAGFYTSGNDERIERHFMWTDTGYPEPVNYTNWRVDQPNNVGGVQDCILLQYAATGYEWGDVNCNDHHPYICELRL